MMPKLLVLVGLVGLPFSLLGAAFATLNFRGAPWRIAASVPLIAVGLYFAVVLIPDWTRDRTSHNLFPLELAGYFWPAVLYVPALALAYRFSRKPAAEKTPVGE